MSKAKQLTIKRVITDFDHSELENKAWSRAQRVKVDSYWSGKKAPKTRSFVVDALWSDDFVYFRFDAEQAEGLNLSVDPAFGSRRMGIWDHDVCEIFIAPDRSEPGRYFEFEVAPTGEWIDLAIDSTGGDRKTDWDFASGMSSVARIQAGRVSVSMRIPWTGIGRRPAGGESWQGNLYRCVGTEPDRGYLAWSPTGTDVPNFHVPERFGDFVFVDEY